MEITNNMNSLQSLLASEQNKAVEKTEIDVSKQEENISEEVQKSGPALSERMTIASGGTVSYSIDGDVMELSAAASNNMATLSATETTEESTETETSGGDSTTQATNLVLRGYSDSKIKEETGISQYELNKIKQLLEKPEVQENTDSGQIDIYADGGSGDN